MPAAPGADAGVHRPLPGAPRPHPPGQRPRLGHGLDRRPVRPAQHHQAPDLVRVFDPAWISPTTKMYQNLSDVDDDGGVRHGPVRERQQGAVSRASCHASPYLVLIAIVAVTGFVQQRQIQGRNPNARCNPQQQMIMKIMPIFLPVISFGLPAGLVALLRRLEPVPDRPAGVHLPQHLRRQGQRDDVEGHARARQGPGQAGQVQRLEGRILHDKAKAKGKAIPASSKVLAKGKTPARSSSKATAEGRRDEGQPSGALEDQFPQQQG